MEGTMNLDPSQFGPWVAIPFIAAVMACIVWIGIHALRNGGDLPIFPALLLIGLLGGMMMASYTPKPDEWAAFKAAHNCKVIAKRDGHSNDGVGFTTRGSVAVIAGDRTPDQTAYLCDDGVTYWKNER
ncbi:hypothetical protein RN20_13065 [Xanthomonas phaseoli pv. phaseoli]|uniref:Transmembrane protein n=3 Tax=Xanthomonas TaxID=338 RepID=A0AB34QKN2_XANCH|nr:hypothetical protein XcfCFBP6167P_23935 [Xanthomonas citri pv. phaseoli var. fuscans]KHS36656.1 hypothetical protein RN20_13065 [Xanthomonas phaseoli pv. phaseoli]TBW92922.1 hypothetical protein TP49_23860 [Xanthomonas citri pv. aurantifolii]